MRRTFESLVLIAAAAMACAVLFGCEEAPTGPPAPPAGVHVPDALHAAHTAYLAGDLKTTVAQVREVLADPNSGEAVRENAIGLIDAAYAVRGGRLPARWSLPVGVTRLRVAHVRKEEPNKVRYGLEIGGVSQEAETVEQVRLVRASDGVVICDRRAGVGQWTVDAEEDGSGWWFEVEGLTQREPARDGLYYVDLTVGGVETHGFIVLSGLTSTASPVMSAPAAPATVSARNPQVAFEDFRSPESRPWERRSMGVFVVRLAPGSARGWVKTWSLWTADMGRTAVTIGEEDGGTPRVGLTDGDYWVGLTFNERRRFGPVVLVRSSRTSRPFRVVGPRHEPDPDR